MQHRNPLVRRAARPIASLLCAASLLAAGSAALAQPPPPPPPPAPADPPQAAQPGDDVSRALDDARRELESAQRDFENAARNAERERQRAIELEERRLAQVQEQRGAAEERQAGLEESRGELESARRELEAARRNLEEAAREVARLSARTVRPIMQDLQLQWLGSGQRAMLGLVVEDDARGARVTAVSPGGPADEAGIEIGDVITAIDGRALVDDGRRRPSRALIERLSEIDPGATVSLGVARGDETRAVEVETRERGERVFAFEAPRFQVFTNLFQPDRWRSMELVPLTPALGAYFGTERGLLVVRAPDDESLMLEDGDVILDINGREPNSPEHAMRILGTFEPGETIELTIMRRQQQMTLEIPVSNREPERAPSSSGESA